jgi:hypothetical protein
MVTKSVANGYCSTTAYDVQLSQLHNEDFSKGGIDGKGISRIHPQSAERVKRGQFFEKRARWGLT